MNPYFLAGMVLAALAAWAAGGYFFWRISRRNRSRASGQWVPPVLRLAEQWIAESQRKIEELARKNEQPLSAAQNELLELRLEAGRLPQGVKNLKLVRESLGGTLSPMPLGKGLPEIVRLYLEEGDYRPGDPLYLKTSLGEMPCLEIQGGGDLTDARMKSLLSQAGRLLSGAGDNPVAGGFLYLGQPGHYQACLGNPEWMEGLKSRRLMVMDFKGLTALLTSLRLSKDVERVVATFEEGVQSTLGLAGQSDRMNQALSRLSVRSLKTRTILEGTPPDDWKSPP